MRKWIVSVVAVLLGLGAWFWILSPLTGFHPRSGDEAYFQQVINEADISDSSLDPGWDSEDVTGTVCNRVDTNSLNGLGLPLGVNITKPGSDIWTVKQDKGLLAACADHTQRYLEIAIDRTSSICTATVSVFPTCDP
jgi:hypothetical protein